MALGDSKCITAAVKKAFEGAYNLSSDTIAWAFSSDQFSAIDENATSLTLADITVIAAGGNYTPGTAATNVTLVQAGGDVEFDCDGLSVAADASNPSAVRSLIFYNDTSAADDVLFVVDLTSDGSTAQTMVNGFTDTIDGLMSISVN